LIKFRTDKINVLFSPSGMYSFLSEFCWKKLFTGRHKLKINYKDIQKSGDYASNDAEIDV
jgi:hypothetical protein